MDGFIDWQTQLYVFCENVQYLHIQVYLRPYITRKAGLLFQNEVQIDEYIPGIG